MNTYAGIVTSIVGLGLLYAGYRRGTKVARVCKEKKAASCPVVLPTIGWSFLGPVGPGYLIGRIAS